MSTLVRTQNEGFRERELGMGEATVDQQVALNGLKYNFEVAPTDQTGLNSGSSRRPDEELIPDVRNGLRPAEMVDQKLEAVLGGNYRGIRRIAGK